MNRKLKLFIIFTLIIMLSSGLIAQNNPSPQMTAANELVKQKRWAEAENAFSAIVKDEPQNARAWFSLGFARHSQENWKGAIEAFKKNVEIANVASGMYNVAAGYSRLNQKDLAFEWLEKALENGAAFGSNIGADEDFENIKNDARFEKMLELVKRKLNPCMYSEEARQFDFWLGDWDVFVGGNKVGENLIELDTQGCTLVENWTNNGGGKGKSLNVYNAAKKKWQQFYVGGQGGVLEFDGNYKPDEKIMYFTAETTGPNGVKTMHILDFHDLPDKTVRQRWQQSTDGGKTWNNVWDSIYKKKGKTK
ncbi:MAG: tetratricopeptide repeat protein [Pyrinomonadaceae bacterium]